MGVDVTTIHLGQENISTLEIYDSLDSTNTFGKSVFELAVPWYSDLGTRSNRRAGTARANLDL